MKEAENLDIYFPLLFLSKYYIIALLNYTLQSLLDYVL